MTDITHPTWGKKLKFAKDGLTAAEANLASANTPGLTLYWTRIRDNQERRVQELTAFIDANPEKEDEPCQG